MIFDIKLRAAQDTRLAFPLAAPLPLAPVDPSSPIPPYAADWRFHLPAFAFSPSSGRAWKLQLNLRSICAAFSDRVKLVDFLLRREHSQELLLQTLRAYLSHFFLGLFILLPPTLPPLHRFFSFLEGRGDPTASQPPRFLSSTSQFTRILR